VAGKGVNSVTSRKLPSIHLSLFAAVDRISLCIMSVNCEGYLFGV